MKYGNDILEFLRPLIYYSQIHTVRGVQPVDMITHEEAWRKAQKWMNDNYDIVESVGGNYRVPKQSSAPESEEDEKDKKITKLESLIEDAHIYGHSNGLERVLYGESWAQFQKETGFAAAPPTKKSEGNHKKKSI